jgi:hypothetical protein
LKAYVHLMDEGVGDAAFMHGVVLGLSGGGASCAGVNRRKPSWDALHFDGDI